MQNNKFVYLLSSNDIFKVGYSSDPFRRLKDYKTHNPQVMIIGIFKVSDKSIEKSIHMELLKRGYKKSTQPEWFQGDLSSKQLESIISIINTKRKYCGLDNREL